MPPRTAERAQFSKTEKLDDLLLFKADYRKFQFCRHAHEEFALGVMEKGTQKFRYRGEDVSAGPGSIITVNAEEVHDGRSANGENYKYWIIYIPQALFQQAGKELVSPRSNHYFSKPVINDQSLAQKLTQVIRSVQSSTFDVVEAQSSFYLLFGQLLNKYGSETSWYDQVNKFSEPVKRATEYINDMALEEITLNDIAKEAGLSRFHFLRIFSKEKGMPPHSYLIHRRLILAKDAIRKGENLADAAYKAKFSDQSHFSNKFRSFTGSSPLQYVVEDKQKRAIFYNTYS